MPQRPLPGRRSLTSNQWLILAVLVAIAIAGLSLVFVYAIGFDASGWIVYGREAFGPGALDTSRNPAWKPLPIVASGIFSLISPGRADAYFWLLCARTLGVLLVLGAARLAARYGGRWAGLVTGVLIVISPWWLANTALGEDGPVAAAFVVGAILAHQRGWARVAGLSLVCAALVRPEAALFVLLFGVWAWRRGELTLWEVAGAIVLIALLWAVPNILHTGASPGSIASRGGIRGTPIRAPIPFLAEFTQSGRQLFAIPTVLVIVAAVATIWHLRARGARLGQGGGIGEHPAPGVEAPASSRRLAWLTGLWGRSAEETLLLAAGLGWIVIIGLETIDGFSGNVRYTIVGYALLSVVVGVVAVRIVARLSRASAALASAVAVVACAATVFSAVSPLRSQHHLIGVRRAELPTMRAEIRALNCPGYVWTGVQNSAYLAMLAREPLQDSVLPSRKHSRLILRGRGYVHCAPAGWRPSG